MNVLVTDGDARPALAIVRSLGRRGVGVVVGEERRGSLASASRHCVRHVTYPSPYRDREAFERFLQDYVERERIDVVIPVTDVTTHSMSRNQDALGRHAAMACPPFEAFELASDKGRLLQAALRCGVPVPRTVLVDGIAELKGLLRHVEYPAVVKPTRSRIATPHGWHFAAVHYASCEADLWRLYQETDYLTSGPSLIQERIVGPGLGVFVLFDRGEPVSVFAHRRLREKPPSGGVSVLRESVHLDPRLKDHARRLLGPLGWHGVAMMEYKQDRRTGNVFLMEVNGRFWGSLQLAVDAGVDFPYQVCQLALGRRPETPRTYRLGVKSRWLLGDLDHLLLRLFRRDRDLRLPDGAPSRARTLLDFLKFVERGLHYEILDRDDLGPFLYELRQYVKSLAAGAARRVARRVAGLVSAARSIGHGSQSARTGSALGASLIGAAILALAACNRLGSADPSAEVVNFESTWDTATGASKEAVTDGGRWPNYWEFNNGANVQLLSVVPGGPNGHNALRVQQRGKYAAFVQVDDMVPESRDYYLRFYMKNDDTSDAEDHVATVDFKNYGNLTYMRKAGDDSGWMFVISMYGCGGAWPIAHWGPPDRLARDEWYRFEYFVHYADRNDIQVHPRVYDSRGALLYEDADFQQQDYKKGGVWNGRDDWTLASYYAAGHEFCVEPAWTNDFALGNNGQAGAHDTGRYWHFSALQVRSDSWPGPVGRGPGQ